MKASSAGCLKLVNEELASASIRNILMWN